MSGFDVDIELSGILNSCPKMKIFPTKGDLLENSVKINVNENSIHEHLNSPKNHRNTIKLKLRSSRMASDEDSLDNSLRE